MATSAWGDSWSDSWGSAWGDVTAVVVAAKPKGKTYLQLCQDLRRECSVAGLGPATVLGQVGLLDRITKWVRDGYNDIQILRPDWRWMRSEFTFETEASKDSYPFWECIDERTAINIDRFAYWWPHDSWNPFKFYRTIDGLTGQRWLTYVPWPYFKHIYRIGQPITGLPSHVSIDDDDQIVIGPKPDGAYTVTGEYQRGPQVLVNDSDEPEMPLRFHDLITYYAMERYASDAVAPEVLARAMTEGTRMMRALESSQLPKMTMGGPLA
jgi:hypothetical protein